jgi:uncharacterized repeat protein (TIGR03803 family)
MPPKKLSLALTATLAMTLLATGSPLAVAQEDILYSFGGTDGAYPQASLTLDAVGNLYGTTTLGGAYNYGTAFELTPQSGGGSTEKILYSFGSGKDGLGPYASLIFDAAGNLYGTTYGGGAYGHGTVFELMPQSGGGWKAKVLHSFGQGKDGTAPYAGLSLDTAGNLYGATTYGGAYNLGTAFELTPKAGAWTEKILHSFGNGKDAASPYAGLILDAAGNLYGTTYDGGTDALGAVFELIPKAGGKWTEKLLHSFNGKDGEYPRASLIFDASGNLYGTTSESIFELTPKAGGRWTEKVLSNFGSAANLVFDTAGNLFGTTTYGGPHDYGTLFELTRNRDGKWTFIVVYAFTGGADGAYPGAGLVLASSGSLFGTTYQGGVHDFGTVFEFTPKPIR